jgi:hypothetical protein
VDSERDREEPWAVADLRPASFESVADRLVVSTTFEELVYRESEMDALFTLVDIAVKEAERARADTLPAGAEPSGLEQSLRALRTLIFSAHDLSHDDRNEEAAAVLRDAAELARHIEEGKWRTKT